MPGFNSLKPRLLFLGFRGSAGQFFSARFGRSGWSAGGSAWARGSGLAWLSSGGWRAGWSRGPPEMAGLRSAWPLIPQEVAPGFSTLWPQGSKALHTFQASAMSCLPFFRWPSSEPALRGVDAGCRGHGQGLRSWGHYKNSLPWRGEKVESIWAI